jgi:GNAT superfamily N-acetyltransferase
MPEVIFEDRARHLVIERSGACNAAFVELLARTVWGSGGVQYTMPGIAETLQNLKAPHFLSLKERGDLAAVLTVIPKKVLLGGKMYPACYSYALAVAPHLRRRGYGALLSGQALRYGLGLLGEKGIYYGYVEADNTNSLKTLEKVGRRAIGQFQILAVSRVLPKDDARLEQPAATEKDRIVRLLTGQYADHALLDFEQSVKWENYHLIREGKEIAAGLQCQRGHLTIKYLPGPGGVILSKVLPYIPILGNLFPDRNYRFLTFGNIYAARGREAEIFTLMEALLARNRLHFGMIYLDRRSPMYQRLKAAGKFGVLHKLIDVPVQVMAFLKGFTAEETAAIRQQPLFISMQDPV